MDSTNLPEKLILLANAIPLIFWLAGVVKGLQGRLEVRAERREASLLSRLRVTYVNGLGSEIWMCYLDSYEYLRFELKLDRIEAHYLSVLEVKEQKLHSTLLTNFAEKYISLRASGFVKSEAWELAFAYSKAVHESDKKQLMSISELERIRTLQKR